MAPCHLEAAALILCLTAVCGALACTQELVACNGALDTQVKAAKSEGNVTAQCLALITGHDCFGGINNCEDLEKNRLDSLATLGKQIDSLDNCSALHQQSRAEGVQKSAPLNVVSKLAFSHGLLASMLTLVFLIVIEKC